MDYKRALKLQTEDFLKYRRYQKRLTKLRTSSPDPANVPKAKALLAQINGLLTDMDKHADMIMAELKPKQVTVKDKLPGKLPVTN